MYIDLDLYPDPVIVKDTISYELFPSTPPQCFPSPGPLGARFFGQVYSGLPSTSDSELSVLAGSADYQPAAETSWRISSLLHSSEGHVEDKVFLSLRDGPFRVKHLRQLCGAQAYGLNGYTGDEVLNNFCSLLQLEAHLAQHRWGATFPRIRILSMHTLNTQPNYDITVGRKLGRLAGIFDADLVLVPCFVGGLHFGWIWCNPKKQWIQSVDPLGPLSFSGEWKILVERLHSLLAAEWSASPGALDKAITSRILSLKQWNRNPPFAFELPRQSDGFNCAIIVLLGLFRTVVGASLRLNCSRRSLESFRIRVADSILSSYIGCVFPEAHSTPRTQFPRLSKDARYHVVLTPIIVSSTQHTAHTFLLYEDDRDYLRFLWPRESVLCHFSLSGRMESIGYFLPTSPLTVSRCAFELLVVAGVVDISSDERYEEWACAGPSQRPMIVTDSTSLSWDVYARLVSSLAKIATLVLTITDDVAEAHCLLTMPPNHDKGEVRTRPLLEWCDGPHVALIYCTLTQTLHYGRVRKEMVGDLMLLMYGSIFWSSPEMPLVQACPPRLRAIADSLAQHLLAPRDLGEPLWVGGGDAWTPPDLPSAVDIPLCGLWSQFSTTHAALTTSDQISVHCGHNHK